MSQHLLNNETKHLKHIYGTKLNSVKMSEIASATKDVAIREAGTKTFYQIDVNQADTIVKKKWLLDVPIYFSEDIDELNVDEYFRGFNLGNITMYNPFWVLAQMNVKHLILGKCILSAQHRVVACNPYVEHLTITKGINGNNQYLVYLNNHLKTITFVKDCKFTSAGNNTAANAFAYNNALEHIYGNVVLDGVAWFSMEESSLKTMNLIVKQPSTIKINAPNLEYKSLKFMIDNLCTIENSKTYTLTLGSTLLAKLTDEDKKIATDKGWTLA